MVSTSFLWVITLLLTICNNSCLAFTTTNTKRYSINHFVVLQQTQKPTTSAININSNYDEVLTNDNKNKISKTSSADTSAGITTTITQRILSLVSLVVLTFPIMSYAADASDTNTSLDYVELPPPWIPVLFGVIVLGGVGLLTSSLGDVMDEESKLGMQSGARAKKETERSRASYLKKK